MSDAVRMGRDIIGSADEELTPATWPWRAAQRGLLGFTHDFGVIERGELARLAQDAAVHDHGVDIARLRQRDQRLVGIADRRHVDVGGAHEDDVGALAGRERAGLVGDAEVDRAIERCELHQALHRQRHLVADAVLMQREQNAHGDERIAIVVGGVVGREADLDARLQHLAELDDAELGRPARLARGRHRVADPARLQDRALLRRGEQRVDELQVVCRAARPPRAPSSGSGRTCAA